MKSKDYCIECLESEIISFNKYHEDPLGETELKKNTLDTLGLLEGYFKILEVKKKKVSKEIREAEDYDKYPDDVKTIIQQIIALVNDGRDLWDDSIEYYNYDKSGFNHEQGPRKRKRVSGEKNNHICFENRPWKRIERIFELIEELKEIINSEKATANLEQYANDNKFYYFEGYESGSAYVKFSKISKNKENEYTFDGVAVFVVTPNNNNGDGIVINDMLEDYGFYNLPYYYTYIEDVDEDEDTSNAVERFIKSAKVYTTEELKKKIHETMDLLMDCNDIR